VRLLEEEQKQRSPPSFTLQATVVVDSARLDRVAQELMQSHGMQDSHMAPVVGTQCFCISIL
jgi:hypothetical protein